VITLGSALAANNTTVALVEGLPLAVSVPDASEVPVAAGTPETWPTTAG
jgi:hypothetical protein